MRLRNIFITAFFFLTSYNIIFAQGSNDSVLIGSWQGIIYLDNVELPLFVKITKINGVLKGSFDSPSQDANNIPLLISRISKDTITFSANQIAGVYKAFIDKDSLKLIGSLVQGEKSIPLIFNKVFEPVSENKSDSLVVEDNLRDSLLYGNWQGDIKVNGMNLPLILKFSRSKAGFLICLLDSPQQGAKDIPMQQTFFEGDSVKIIANNIKAMYIGKLEKDNNIINGNWYQSGQTFPLNLAKTEKPLTINRPQEPKGPYPYNEEEVTFTNKKANIKLAGTLTTPKTGSNFPAVVMITGSGPQDRDENIFNHKPFKVIADYLTRLGIAVLRFDDRGIGKSEGNFQTANTMDFSTDVLAAVDFLKTRKGLNKKKIGLIGHSEGGIIAPMCALTSKNISFIIMLAGTGVKGDVLLLEQSRLINLAYGADTASINRDLELAKKIYPELQNGKSDKEVNVIFEKLYTDYWNSLPDSLKENKPLPTLIKQSKSLLTPWFRFFLSYDPYQALKRLKTPVLALNGSFDLQVSPKQNLPAIEKGLKEAGNKNYKIIEIPGLNHLFQNCKTGSPGEYAMIEETFAPTALKIMGDWILEVTQK